MPDAVITVICAPDDGWSYHPKHVERAVYRNIINCIESHLVGQLLTSSTQSFSLKVIHGAKNLTEMLIYKEPKTDNRSKENWLKLCFVRPLPDVCAAVCP